MDKQPNLSQIGFFTYFLDGWRFIHIYIKSINGSFFNLRSAADNTMSPKGPFNYGSGASRVTCFILVHVALIRLHFILWLIWLFIKQFCNTVSKQKQLSNMDKKSPKGLENIETWKCIDLWIWSKRSQICDGWDCWDNYIFDKMYIFKYHYLICIVQCAS